MKNIDLLEHGGGHFMLRHEGHLVTLTSPASMHYQEVLACLNDGLTPGLPHGIPVWQQPVVFERWCAAWDLPTFNEARRLAYLVDHYRAAIVSDLATYSNVDLGILWRARRWRTLLDIIDRLPAHSQYSAAASMDEDHAQMMADSIAARRNAGQDEQSEDAGPHLTTWTPEVAVLTSVLDAVRNVQHAVYAAQHGKKAGEPPKAAPRPVTPLQRALRRAEFERRKAAHEALVARVLPHKAAVKG